MMNKYRKKPIVIEAHQWFKNGDHPQDRWAPEGDVPEGWEGRVVRYFRRPDVPGDSLCSECQQPFHIHGWIDTKEDGHRVCPGDWIITGVAGERYPCKPGIFEATYEVADCQTHETTASLIAEVRRLRADNIAPQSSRNRLVALAEQLADALEAAETELQGLREIATSGPSTASGPSPLSHRAAPMEDASPK